MSVEEYQNIKLELSNKDSYVAEYSFKVSSILFLCRLTWWNCPEFSNNLTFSQFLNLSANKCRTQMEAYVRLRHFLELFKSILAPMSWPGECKHTFHSTKVFSLRDISTVVHDWQEEVQHPAVIKTGKKTCDCNPFYFLWQEIQSINVNNQHVMRP